MSIYDQLKETGCEINNHESDLYVPVNDSTKALVEQYEHKSNVSSFISQIDGKLWYDVPFAFDPWWDRAEASIGQWFRKEAK